MWEPRRNLRGRELSEHPPAVTTGVLDQSISMEMAGPLASIRCDRDPSLTQGHRNDTEHPM